MELSRAVNGDAFAKVVQLHRQLEKEQGCHAEVVGEWFSFADIIGKVPCYVSSLIRSKSRSNRCHCLTPRRVGNGERGHGLRYSAMQSAPQSPSRGCELRICSRRTL